MWDGDLEFCISSMFPSDVGLGCLKALFQSSTQHTFAKNLVGPCSRGDGAHHAHCCLRNTALGNVHSAFENPTAWVVVLKLNYTLELPGELWKHLVPGLHPEQLNQSLRSGACCQYIC